MFLTFWGKPRWAASEHIQHALHGDHHDHPDAEDAGHDTRPHEAGRRPRSRPAPAATIRTKAPGRCWCRWACFRSARSSPASSSTAPFIEAEEGAHFWGGSIAFDAHLAHAIHEVPLWVKLAPGTVMIIGFLIAFQAYIRNTAFPARFVGQWGCSTDFLSTNGISTSSTTSSSSARRCGSAGCSGSAATRARSTASAPTAPPAAVVVGNVLTARLQSGYLYTYALVMLLGLAAAATWAMAR